MSTGSASTRSVVTLWHVLTATVCGTVAVTAYGGAIGLISGGLPLGPGLDSRLPLGSLLVAGLALLGFVAVPMSMATLAALRPHPTTPSRVLLAGIMLVVWIAVELLFLRAYAWLQPLYLLIGAAVVGLAWVLSRRSLRRRPGRGIPHAPKTRIDELGRW